MPFEAKRFRHVAVAIPEVAIGGFVTTRPGQQRPQPQPGDFVQNEPWIGRCRRQPVNGGGAIMCGITPSA